MSLKKFIEKQNQMAKIFNAKTYDPKNLSEADKKELARMLARDLSPECLTCDGELRGARLQAKAKMLNAAVAELGIDISMDY